LLFSKTKTLRKVLNSKICNANSNLTEQPVPLSACYALDGDHMHNTPNNVSLCRSVKRI